jgi:hypothetical protein
MRCTKERPNPTHCTGQSIRVHNPGIRFRIARSVAEESYRHSIIVAFQHGVARSGDKDEGNPATPRTYNSVRAIAQLVEHALDG